jgi:hypothetical protein
MSERAARRPRDRDEPRAPLVELKRQRDAREIATSSLRKTSLGVDSKKGQCNAREIATRGRRGSSVKKAARRLRDRDRRPPLKGQRDAREIATKHRQGGRIQKEQRNAQQITTKVKLTGAVHVRLPRAATIKRAARRLRDRDMTSRQKRAARRPKRSRQLPRDRVKKKRAARRLRDRDANRAARRPRDRDLTHRKGSAAPQRSRPSVRRRRQWRERVKRAARRPEIATRVHESKGQRGAPEIATLMIRRTRQKGSATPGKSRPQTQATRSKGQRGASEIATSSRSTRHAISHGEHRERAARRSKDRDTCAPAPKDPVRRDLLERRAALFLPRESL